MLRAFRLSAIATAVALAIGYVVYFPGFALSQGTAPWPVGTAVTLNTTASQQIIGTNASRRFLQICNVASPSTLIVWIAPSGITAAINGAGSIPLTSLAASSTTVSSNCYNSPVTGSVGQAWNAITPTTTPVTLTIYEY
jgi:hypothetical protein